MRDRGAKLDAFLRFSDRGVLKHPGRVSMEVAQALALEEFEKYDRARLEHEAAVEDDIDRTAWQLERWAAKPSRGKALRHWALERVIPMIAHRPS